MTRPFGPIDLPTGCSAWANGQPVRRIATMVNGEVRCSTDLTGTPLTPEWVAQLNTDLEQYGDAWITMSGERVDPASVTVIPSAAGGTTRVSSSGPGHEQP
jgi:hypothetical protein